MDNITFKDIKILKYVKKHSCKPSELPASLGKTAKARFDNLYDLGYFAPASYTKNEFGEITSSGIYKLSDKGIIFLENLWSIKIDNLKAFIRKEIATIITAFITALITSVVAHLVFPSIIKLFLR